MTLLTEQKIATAIHGCVPRKIAVAYLGADWKIFIKVPEAIEYVIVSPTLGTNPYALSELAELIGWDKVLLLDELHAKAFLGRNGAVLGSANLTRNGLSGEGLTELCVVVDDGRDLKELEALLDGWRDEAMARYPTEKSKRNKLVRLSMLWAKAMAHRLVAKPAGGAPKLADFNLLGNDDFYVIWYQDVDFDYTGDLKDIESLVKDCMLFAREDRFSANKWILVWKATNSMRPSRAKGSEPYWMYIHESYTDCVVGGDEDYPVCAVQRWDKGTSPRPFRLTAEVIGAFRKTIVRPELREYFIQPDKVFMLSESRKGLPLLVELMKQELAAAGK